ncbi:MAG: hypothetical protein IJ422_04005 [Oscillospiraceae bacterium]|nr:hypothetical protein [Oscillospiraceae bacterium]
MFHAYTEEELRSFCRQSIESLEMWARRLIHEKLTEKYGTNYVVHKTSEENYLIKREIRDHIQGMLQNNNGRFHRAVDTLFFEHIIYFLCNPTFYRDLFGEALKYAYPNGCNEARTFLERITPIRNALSHSNPISIRQAEQAVCYSHDFIDSLKKYYKEKGVEQMWNVPRIIRVSDSLGNVFDNPVDTHGYQSIFNLSQEIHCGDTFSVSVEVDNSFLDSEYDITWTNQNTRKQAFDNCKHFTITFDESDVAQIHTINCVVKSHKGWHKYQNHDCRITLMFAVLPPV